ncbi:MAG: toll/interleukin-1 receptor domain-containing protein [Planctomycetes bacterium]|nr:toll/interleukin-1 receptor domain-containing protein [Planctomycetota bacterium]
MGKRKPVRGPRVFLSHSSQDRWISERLKEQLEAKGIEVWLDAYDLPGGRNVKKEIRDGLRSSTECLILLSPASRDSDWVKHEAGIADGFGLPIALVLLHVDEDHVPEPLRDLSYFNLNKFPNYVEQLARSAKRKQV